MSSARRRCRRWCGRGSGGDRLCGLIGWSAASTRRGRGSGVCRWRIGSTGSRRTTARRRNLTGADLDSIDMIGTFNRWAADTVLANPNTRRRPGAAVSINININPWRTGVNAAGGRTATRRRARSLGRSNIMLGMAGANTARPGRPGRRRLAYRSHRPASYRHSDCG